MTRRQIRENIFKALFRVEFNPSNEWPEQLELHLDETKNPLDDDEVESYKAEDLDLAYIKQKTEDIEAHLADIDATLSENMEGWSLTHIGKAELSILRLAVYEMKYDEDVPEGVAINEAVELSKMYCGEDAKSFVNGVLAKLAKDVK